MPLQPAKTANPITHLLIITGPAVGDLWRYVEPCATDTGDVTGCSTTGQLLLLLLARLQPWTACLWNNDSSITTTTTSSSSRSSTRCCSDHSLIILGSAAAGCRSTVVELCQAKITQLDLSFAVIVGRYAGFKSLWMTPCNVQSTGWQPSAGGQRGV